MEDKLSLILKKLESIERGLYGDNKNGNKGVISTQQEHEDRLSKVEKRQFKITVLLLSIITIIQVLSELL